MPSRQINDFFTKKETKKIELVARHVVFQLSLDEFANVDLDAMTEEQDPPSFKAARKRDRDRLLQVRSIKSILSNNLSIFKYHCNQGGRNRLIRRGARKVKK